jgi:hypothetical protein
MKSAVRARRQQQPALVQLEQLHLSTTATTKLIVTLLFDKFILPNTPSVRCAGLQLALALLLAD